MPLQIPNSNNKGNDYPFVAHAQISVLDLFTANNKSLPAASSTGDGLQIPKINQISSSEKLPVQKEVQQQKSPLIKPNSITPSSSSSSSSFSQIQPDLQQPSISPTYDQNQLAIQQQSSPLSKPLQLSNQQSQSFLAQQQQLQLQSPLSSQYQPQQGLYGTALSSNVPSITPFPPSQSPPVFGDSFSSSLPVQSRNQFQQRQQQSSFQTTSFSSYDSITPDTFITSSIDGNNVSIQNGATSTSNEIKFTFAGVDNVAISGFECSLDNGSPFTCSLRVVISNLSVSSHTFAVSAVDAYGNKDPAPATFSWAIAK
jgi:hypothetical protein